MIKFNNLKKILTFSILIFTAAAVFCQTSDEDLLNTPENEEENDELLPEDFLSENELEKDSSIDPELQKKFTIAHTGNLLTLNPYLSSYSSETQILINVYEGLFSYNPVNLEPEFALAKEYKISRDKKRWTFILKDNICFSNGKQITAEDVKKSWINLLKTKNAPFSSYFDIVKGARDFRLKNCTEDQLGIYVIDEKSISLHLNAPAAHLTRLLCMTSFAIVPEDPGVFSGAYVIASLNPTELVLIPNKYYYDKDKVNLKMISYLLNDDPDENAYLYNIGEADWVSGAVNSERIINMSAQQLTAEYGTEYYFFKLYNDDSPLRTPDYNIWKQKEFRAALLEAVPWDSLRKQTFVPARTLVYPLNGYPEVQGYDYTDKIEAENLLAEARKKYNIPDDKKLSLKICVTQVSENKTKFLKEAWENLGIDVEIIIIKNEEYLSRINSVSADVYLYSWIGDFSDPLSFLELFRVNSSLNVSNWQDSEYENLLNQAAACTDENHDKLLAGAEQILLDSAMILPVQHPVTLNVINLNEVAGWHANAFDLHPLKFIYKKAVKKSYPGLVILK